MKLLSYAEIEKEINSANRVVGITLDEAKKYSSRVLSERMSKEGVVEFGEEARNQAIGKIATKVVTGMLGKPLAQLMAVAVIKGVYLTQDELYDLHKIEQIGVQFKNIAKRNQWEIDYLVLEAMEVASKYGIENIVLDALKMVRKEKIEEIVEDKDVTINELLDKLANNDCDGIDNNDLFLSI